MVLAGGQKACRQLRDNKRVLAQVTMALIREGEWTYFKYWSAFFIAHAGAIIKKAFDLVRCDKAIQLRSVQASLFFWKYEIIAKYKRELIRRKLSVEAFYIEPIKEASIAKNNLI